ncbi:MAG: tellurite resistance TerB family protein [Henriciella sp.]|nr:tellurite resistance TerB family protein [Henriciella sp.]
MDTNSIGFIFKEVKPDAEQEVEVSDFFDNVPSANDWSIAEAYMCLLLEAIFADDIVAPAEQEYMKALVKRCKTFAGMSENELARINMTVMERRTERPDCVKEACMALPPGMHKTIFAHAIDIVLADGEMHPRERDFLDNLMQTMDISPETARNIMQVIFDKNRF